MFLGSNRALQEDIEKQVSVLDDLRSKAETLSSSNSPDVKEQIDGQLSQATHKLNSATNRLKDLVNNQEKAVEDHENFDSSVKELSELMASINHGLSQLDGVPDDKQAVEEALKRVQALKTQIPVGQDLIHKVDERARATLASTTAPGQPAIKDQVLSARDGWNAAVTRLTNEEAALAGRLGGWNEYDGLMDGLERWLQEAEETLKETGRPREDLEGKREAVEQCKGLKLDIANRSPQTKILAEKASKLSNKKEIARAKDVINRFRKLHTETNAKEEALQKIVDEHQTYQTTLKDCSELLMSQGSKVKDTAAVSGDKTQLEQKLAALRELDQTTAGRQPVMEDLVVKADAASANTAPPGQAAINDQVKQVQDDLQSLKLKLADSEEQIVKVLHLWNKFDGDCKELSDWFKEAEDTIQKAGELQSTADEKRDQADSIAAVCEAVREYQPTVESLSKQVDGLFKEGVNDPEVRNTASKLARSHTDIIQKAEDCLTGLETRAEDHSSMDQEMGSLSTWIQDRTKELEPCCKVAADKETNKARLQQVRAILALLPEGESLLDGVTSHSDQVVPDTARPGQDRISRQVQSLGHELEALRMLAQDSATGLDQSQKVWEEYEEKARLLGSWIDGVQTETKELAEAECNDLDSKKARLEKVQDLLAQSESQQPIREDVTSLGHKLVTFNPNVVHVSSEATKLAAQYQSLHMNLKELEHSAEKAVEDEAQYQAARQECLSWQQAVEDRLAECDDLTGSKDDLQHRLQAVQELMSSRHRGQSLAHAAVSKAEKAQVHTSPRGREQMEEEASSMSKKYDDLVEKMGAAKEKLQSNLRDWDALNASQEKFLRWIQEASAQLEDARQPKASLTEKKAQLDRCKCIQQDIKQHQADLDKVTAHAQKLSAENPQNQPIREALDELVTKFDNLKALAEDALTFQTTAVTDHQSLQQTQQAFNQKLRDTKHQLMTRADPSGSRETIQNKLAGIQVSVGSQILRREEPSAQNFSRPSPTRPRRRSRPPLRPVRRPSSNSWTRRRPTGTR
ncbi:muscle-specific protein 300 kDa-like [Diadema antillarum]|uniref:muscle-specific protein 300 kDa-like n=1 Tax=Diadema antillarum TaxID=105358 RepID=UPI003A8A45DC